jgi:phosphotransferase system HPr-like phosphotransfer protein
MFEDQEDDANPLASHYASENHMIGANPAISCLKPDENVRPAIDILKTIRSMRIANRPLKTTGKMRPATILVKTTKGMRSVIRANIDLKTMMAVRILIRTKLKTIRLLRRANTYVKAIISLRSAIENVKPNSYLRPGGRGGDRIYG